MKSSRNTARQLFGLTLTLVGLLSWHILPIAHPELAVRAANRVRGAGPTGQGVSRAAANGRVAFVSSEGNARSDIYTMNPDGSNVQRLTNNQAYDSGPKWSPDGTRIAFASNRDDTSDGCTSGGGCPHEIYVMNADGTNQTRTNKPGFDDSFDWSPDSTRIVFESGHDGSVNGIGSISVMNADGSNVHRLTNYPGYDFSPKWSPDGTRIAFIRGDDWFDQGFRIYVMNADGTNQTQLSDPGADPRWSPDGTKIAFISNRDNNFEIYVMNADGSNQTRLTGHPAPDLSPKWSPDGSKITFAKACERFACPTQHIWVVNADGSNPTQLTDILAYLSAWSPDGTKIIFGGPGSGAADIFVINPDGSGLTNITNTDGKSETSPSWQPLSLPPVVNPIDDPQFFVREHYLDFLNREPDAPGLAHWAGEITACDDPSRRQPGESLALCIERKRTNTSAAFFLSPEFQYTGYYVYRLYKGSLLQNGAGRFPTYQEFLRDVRQVASGIIQNNQVSAAKIEENKKKFTEDFIQRAEFRNLYDSLSNFDYVERLFQTTGISVSAPEKQGLVAGLNNQSETRASVLQKVVDGVFVISEGNHQFTTPYGQAFYQKEFNAAFVLMEYFGYLRRDPDAAGYQHWLDKLNFYGNYLDAEMVKSFIISPEYRARFGPP